MVPLRHCTGEERVKEGRVLDLFLMQALCSSACWKKFAWLMSTSTRPLIFFLIL